MPTQAIYPPPPAMMFFALLWNEQWEKTANAPKAQMLKSIETTWGPIHSEYIVDYFPMQTHYQKEMGAPLKRSIITLNQLHHRGQLVDAKQWAMALEEKLAQNTKRVVNIDPGLICLEQLLLISTKPHNHRIYVTSNLYIELVYQFEKGHYRPLPWAYPDYQDGNVIGYFEQGRQLLLGHPERLKPIV